MRIGIDYTAAVRQGGGIGRYTRNLIRALANLDRQHQYTLFVAGRGIDRRSVGSWPANFRVRLIPVSDRWLHIFWQRLRVPIPVQTVTGPLDLFHSPDFVLPPVGRTPAMVTVHDLSFLRVPQCFVPGFSRYLTKAVTRAVGEADRILADSESTRSDLQAILGAAPERVRVIYPGVETRFRPVRDPVILERVRERYGLPNRFILGVGTLQPRKNFDGLIESFGRLAGPTQQQAVQDVHLVIAGGAGWMHEDLPQVVRRLGLDERVRFVGFVEDADLPALYSLARVFAFPSWYEGFGLPVLEAMACGTPVIAADNSSIPEVVGGAGCLVEAGDIEALADGLERLLVDEKLRVELMSAGHAQAKGFRWERAASQLLEEYEAMERKQA